MENQSKKKILIIEDEKFLSEMYEIKLNAAGFETTTAIDGEEALEKLNNGIVPDIIILDIILPKMSGLSVLETIRSGERTKNIPVLLLTNLDGKDSREKAKALGVQEYIVKANFTPSEVVEEVRKYTS